MSVSVMPRVASTVPVKLIRLPRVLERTGLSRSTIWRLERAGLFPRRRRVSANVVAWLESEVTAWIEGRSPSVVEAIVPSA
jgi:prophage regulatory protein